MEANKLQLSLVMLSVGYKVQTDFDRKVRIYVVQTKKFI